jgi:hypothetical protein
MQGEHYAHDMIGDFNNGVVGFIDWNLVLGRYGGRECFLPHRLIDADTCEGVCRRSTLLQPCT